MITQREVNNIVVKPVIANGGEPNADKIKGYDFIPLLYANIFLCAKKKSGKTNVIYNLLDNLVGSDTEVFIYASTLHKDATYKALLKMLKKKNITFEAHTSFINAKTGENYLEDVIHRDTSSDEESNADDKRDKRLTSHVRSKQVKPTKGLSAKHNLIRPSEFKSHLPTQSGLTRGPIFGGAGAEAADYDATKNYAVPKTSKSVIAPAKVFIFDDLGSELRHPSITQLLKTNRHEESKVILSSQYITDLQPQAIKQLDFCMLFKAFGEEKLLRMYELFDLSIPWSVFHTIYRVATNAPFSFLYIDVRSERFRKNFNISLDVDAHPDSSKKVKRHAWKI